MTRIRLKNIRIDVEVQHIAASIVREYSYAAHVKCITENQKYGGKNYVEKEAKGEVKQNAWCEQVSRAIEDVRDPQIKKLLQSVQGFGNIPRKEAKFINFLMNSCKLRDRSVAQRTWAAIAEEAEKMRKDAEEKNKLLAAAKAQKSAETATELAEQASVADENDGKTEESQISEQFKWKKAIKRKLKEAGGEMKVKKLRKELLKEYAATTGEEADDETFDAKLSKSGVRVEGKLVLLS
ncbi:unnamed protein product [Caenorhabditis auriculariae]|uniref:Zinc finger C2H2 LYAR-type domain-containing protein n=1 Tax=Caenorhabditis auriculariae TaxID=2777116 RepID=A0A8S1HFA2_9PELO|nr:unnamed protein product [Caenorhabditis auriculariae]